MNYKRILKTGVLAVAVTIAFAIFAYRAAEWSKGLNSEMIVFGQGTNTGGNPGGTATNGCATGATGTSAVAVTKVIPHMALGSFDGGLTKYSTIIQIVNTSGSTQSVGASFYKEDGSALNNATLTAGTVSVTNGVLPVTQIPKDGILVIVGGAANAGTLAWGKITGCGGLSISTFFEYRDGASNVLYSRVGVAVSPANMSAFVIARVRDVASNLDLGFALVNTGTAAANLTAELKDGSGNTVQGGSQTISLSAGAHKAMFTKDLFLH